MDSGRLVVDTTHFPVRAADLQLLISWLSRSVFQFIDQYVDISAISASVREHSTVRAPPGWNFGDATGSIS